MSTSLTNASLDPAIETLDLEGSREWETASSPVGGREALQALLAFSSLHEQIRQRRAREVRRGVQLSADDVWELEQFVLDEVLQLVAERALAITGADGIAIALAEAMIAKFYDSENGGFWQSAADAKDLILRVKDDYDGAEPSGNSVATLALLELAAITDREDFRKPAEATLRLFATRLEKIPQAKS